jgi:hypothetical protein
MAIFFGLLKSSKKEEELLTAINLYRAGNNGDNVYERDAKNFSAIEDAAFLYSVPSTLLELAARKNTLSSIGADVRQGIGAATRFHRLWWEVLSEKIMVKGPHAWPFMAHGSTYSPFYKPSMFRFKWGDDGAEAKADVCHRYPYLNGNYGFKIQAEEHYFKPGLCYGKRTSNFSVQVMPGDHVFSFEGTAIATSASRVDTWTLLGLLNSKPVSYWLSRACAQHKTYNYLQSLPVPRTFDDRLGKLAKRGWQIARTLDTTNETSNAFILPAVFYDRIFQEAESDLESEFEQIKANIDAIAFKLFGFSSADRLSVIGGGAEFNRPEGSEDIEDDEDTDADEADALDQASGRDALLSWAVGVTFGRFDLRLATGKRQTPPEPDPFDPLPTKSPGMLPDDAEPFHVQAGILVDDQGHPHDLALLIEEVLARVDCPVPDDVRRWLQRDFFPFHLKAYSKSRRKAPIYWPLSTPSGRYTLWFYYPSLSDQTLFTAANDFIEPKLERQVEPALRTLRTKTGRSRQEDKELEELQDVADDLGALRTDLLALAPTYKPNHDDGVQITAAPLWRLFRHVAWHKVLKATWGKLEKGEYDWAHLAMAYWPERVREKCRSDRSLAIAHDLEDLYQPPPESATKTDGRGRKRKGGAT